MNKRKCDLCYHDEFFTIGKEKIREIITSTTVMEFDVCIVCCKNCGLVFQNPIQDEKKLEQYYLSMYREEVCRSPQIVESEILHRIDFLEKYRNPNSNQSILEVGCSDGFTLLNFQKKGLLVSGIEPSVENSKICEKRGISVFNGSYREFHESKKFDFICSYYAMEHLTSPTHFLMFCNNLLHKNGIICIEIPDIGAYKKERITYDLLFFFEHQYHFTKETLRILLQKCGFELLDFSKCTTHDFGMHFAAKKVSEPLEHNLDNIPNTIFDNVMKEVIEYRKHFSEQLEHLKLTLSQIFTKNGKQNRKIVLCPASLGTKMLLELPETDFGSIKYIIDNSPNKIGNSFCGFPVRSPKEIDSSVDTIIIMSSFSTELKGQLLSLGVNENKIVVV